MKTETLKASWKKLSPEVAHNYERFSPDEIYHSSVNKADKAYLPTSWVAMAQ